MRPRRPLPLDDNIPGELAVFSSAVRTPNTVDFLLSQPTPLAGVSYFGGDLIVFDAGPMGKLQGNEFGPHICPGSRLRISILTLRIQ